MSTLGERLAHAWNAFMDKEPTYSYTGEAYSSSSRPDRVRMKYGNDRTIVTSIYNRIAVDASAVDIRHVRVNTNGTYMDDINDELNYCLSVEANSDQTGRALIKDTILTMFDEGCAAVVPVDTDINPKLGDRFIIKTLRCGIIREWYPEKIKVELYNEKIGRRQDVIVRKCDVAIIENPFYLVMNSPNGISKRLIRKLALLDVLDEKSCSGKLDVLVKLPYTLKNPLRKQEAEERRAELEAQMNSKAGIGYIDATEQIVQLNRPIENNLMAQIEFLTRMLYSQLNINEDLLNGKATEQVNLNYNNSTLNPILTAIKEEFIRKFLSKTAITQGQSIEYFKKPFNLVPLSNIADFGDKFTRNEILTSNEMRAIIGMKPSNDPNANELRNKSLYPEEGGLPDNMQYAPGSQELQNEGENIEKEEY